MQAPINLGYNNPQGVAGYLNGGTLFVKRFQAKEDGNYSDLGVAFETFSNESFLEVESLGELKEVLPGETAVHIEYWNLMETEAVFDARDEQQIHRFAENYLSEREER